MKNIIKCKVALAIIELFYKDFIQREDNFLRAPYNPEINFYNSIKNG